MPFSTPETSYSPYQVLRVLATLELLGAYDTPIEVSVVGFDHATLFVGYIEGAGAGACEFLLEVSPHAADADAPAGSDAWYQPVGINAPAIVAGTELVEVAQQKILSFTPVGATLEQVTHGPISMYGTMQRMRVSVRESGVTATPGDASIVALFS